MSKDVIFTKKYIFNFHNLQKTGKCFDEFLDIIIVYSPLILYAIYACSGVFLRKYIYIYIG